MRVKFVRSIASSTWSFAAGREYDLRDDVARKWIRQGFAKPVQVQETALAAVEPEVAALTIAGAMAPLRAEMEAFRAEVAAEQQSVSVEEEVAAEAEAPFEEPEPEKKPEKKTPARGRRRAAPAQESTTKNSESAADPT